MNNKLTLALAMICAAVLGVQTARAVNADVTVTLPLDATAVTNTITIPPGAAIDHIVVNNTAAFSNTVTLAIYDANVAGTTLYTGTLLAGGNATTFPIRAVAYGSQTQDFYIVKSVRAIVASASGSTNTTTGPVKIFLQSR